MTKRHLTIATRESPLALKQSEWVKNKLQQLHPSLAIDFLGITTHADKNLHVTLDKIGGKGLFVKELEEALYDGRADIAVHSMKDVPMLLPPELIIPAICEREDPRDAFVSNKYASLAQLPTSAIVGTSSLRRHAQLAAARPDLTIIPLRGNINTRLKRLDDGDYDAIILAAAGLKRMNFTQRIKSYLSTDESLPAAGQGALGIECRENDEHLVSLIKALNDAATFACVTAERAVCRQLQGGCMVPVAAFAELDKDQLTLRGLVANSKGTKILRAHSSGHAKDAENLGKQVAEDLLQKGATTILREYAH